MDEDKICERSAKCPIYSGVLKSNKVLIQTYKSIYCENGKQGRDKCKRYQVAQLAGSCPPDLLPNSKLSIEFIISKIKESR